MTTVLIDAGNSCLKIAIIDNFDDSELSYTVLNYDNLLDNLKQCLSEYIPSKVIISNVNNSTIFYTISDLFYSYWRIQAHLIHVEQDMYGVSTRYTNPRSLGCDRWLTLIAARKEFNNTVCIIDCGTAVTFDVMSDKGMHLGGLISPGISTARYSLNKNTNNLPLLDNFKQNDNNASSFLAINTQDAILGGTLYQINAYIERLISDFKQEFGDDSKCIMTGGDASLLLSFTNHAIHHRDTLVLDGLKIIAKEMSDRTTI